MMFTRSYARVIFLLAIALVTLLLPNLIRPFDTYIGEDSYFYSRIAKMIDNNDFSYDKLSYSGREFTYPLGQPFVFLFFNKILPEQIVVNIIPVILGLISLLLFFLILKELYVEPNVTYFSLLLLAISPPFIYIFSSYNKYTFITFILLLTFYLFIKKNNTLNILSYILFFIIPFFGFQYSLLALSFVLIYCVKEKKIKKFYTILIISILALALIYLPTILKHGFSESAKFDKALKDKSLFSDLGSSFGISIFIIFLSFFGLSYLWKSKYKYFSIYIALILLIIAVFLSPTFIIYLNFMLAFLAALGLIYLIRSKWESETIRKLTIWLLAIGLIFSTVTFIQQTSIEQPNQNLYDALIYLKEEGGEDVVFSHYSYGTFINSIAGKKNVMDSRFIYSPNLNERYLDTKKLFYTRDFNVAFDITNKYNIKYILITKEMKQGLVWQEEDEGLLYLLSSLNNYRIIYENDEVEVWRFRK